MWVFLILNYLIYLNCIYFNEGNIYFFYISFLLGIIYILINKELSKTENLALKNAKIFFFFELEKDKESYELLKRRKNIFILKTKMKEKTGQYFKKMNKNLITNLQRFKKVNIKLLLKVWIESQSELRKEWLLLSLKNDNK